MSPVLTVDLAAKPWWQSKTLWFNAAVALLAAAEATFNVLQPLLPVNTFALLTFALTVGNAVLRVLTTQALAGAAPAPLPPVHEPSAYDGPYGEGRLP